MSQILGLKGSSLASRSKRNKEFKISNSNEGRAGYYFNLSGGFLISQKFQRLRSGKLERETTYGVLKTYKHRFLEELRTLSIA